VCPEFVGLCRERELFSATLVAIKLSLIIDRQITLFARLKMVSFYTASA
jgi:hypothetical protein